MSAIMYLFHFCFIKLRMKICTKARTTEVFEIVHKLPTPPCLASDSLGAGKH